MTQAMAQVARPLGVAVHDHIIVGKEGHASLKGLKLIWRTRRASGSDEQRSAFHIGHPVNPRPAKRA
jgi:hypothetical protein